LPETSTPDQPIEITVLRGDDPIEMARKRGRVLAIVRIGGRTLTQQELIEHDIPGTVQVPGEPLMPASRPPTLFSPYLQMFDRRSGPRVTHEELLQDGGDIGPRLGIGPGGHLGNLDPTDTGIEYRSGTKKLATYSNRICLFAPRFPVLRQELTPAGYDLITPALFTASVAGPNIARVRRPPEHVEAVISPAELLQGIMLRGTQSLQAIHEAEVLRG